jgi:aminoglycoside phosphotransferase
MAQATKPWEEIEQDTDSLASSLGPIITRTCDPRLSNIEWFRSTWQRGGAATGRATWRLDDSNVIPAVVKLPVGPVEYRWTTLLGAVDRDQWARTESRSTPRVLAAGEVLNGYDLAWLVIERLDGPSLTTTWDRRSLLDLIDATACMQARALGAMPVKGRPRPTDWATLLDKARHAVRDQGIDNEQRWNDCIKRVQKSLDALIHEWDARPLDTWCHGDVHAGNAMRRTDNGACVLIDLALVHPGHWVEDAVYLERQFWGRPDLLFGVDPVAELAAARRRQRLEPGPDHRRIADLRRLLAAACAPALLPHEGHPVYLGACLDTLARLLRSMVG